MKLLYEIQDSTNQVNKEKYQVLSYSKINVLNILNCYKTILQTLELKKEWNENNFSSFHLLLSHHIRKSHRPQIFIEIHILCILKHRKIFASVCPSFKWVCGSKPNLVGIFYHIKHSFGIKFRMDISIHSIKALLVLQTAKFTSTAQTYTAQKQLNNWFL